MISLHSCRVPPVSYRGAQAQRATRGRCRRAWSMGVTGLEGMSEFGGKVAVQQPQIMSDSGLYPTFDICASPSTYNHIYPTSCKSWAHRSCSASVLHFPSLLSSHFPQINEFRGTQSLYIPGRSLLSVPYRSLMRLQYPSRV